MLLTLKISILCGYGEKTLGGMNNAIAGKRILLRDWEEKDLPPYWHWRQPGHVWQQFDGPYYQETAEEIKAGFEKLEKQVAERNFPEPRTRLVIADKATDLLIGVVSSYWESIETQWLCAGISLYDEKTWGRGLGKEALGLWVGYLFRARPGLARLDLRTWSGNPGMMRLAEKLGFKLEARFRKARIVNGSYFDSIGYGVLREEWGRN